MRSALLGALFLILLTGSGCGDKPDLYSVSLPSVKASDDETVVAFDLNVSAGTVQAIANPPFGWSLTVDNDIGWHSKVTAKSNAGSASLGSDEMKKIVLTLRRVDAPDFKFNLTGTVTLAKAFANPRTVPVKLADFVVSGS